MLVTHPFYRLHKCYQSSHGGKIVELESRLPISFLISLFGFKGRMEHYTMVVEIHGGKWSCSNGKMAASYSDTHGTLTAMWNACKLKGEIESWEERNLTEDERDIKDIIK